MMGQALHLAARKALLKVLLWELWIFHRAKGLAAIDEVMDEFATTLEQEQDAPFKLIRGGRGT